MKSKKDRKKIKRRAKGRAKSWPILSSAMAGKLKDV
jgi:hypothetical protein